MREQTGEESSEDYVDSRLVTELQEAIRKEMENRKGTTLYFLLFQPLVILVQVEVRGKLKRQNLNFNLGSKEGCENFLAFLESTVATKVAGAEGAQVSTEMLEPELGFLRIFMKYAE